MEKDEARQRQVNRINEENESQRRIHKRLAKWEDTRHRGITDTLLAWAVPHLGQTKLPDPEELTALARHYYPPRSELKCHICDFGEGRAEHKVIDLGQIEEHMVQKPDWVDVRWIHAPLGLGLMVRSTSNHFSDALEVPIHYVSLHWFHQTFRRSEPSFALLQSLLAQMSLCSFKHTLRTLVLHFAWHFLIACSMFLSHCS